MALMTRLGKGAALFFFIACSEQGAAGAPGDVPGQGQPAGEGEIYADAEGSADGEEPGDPQDIDCPEGGDPPDCSDPGIPPAPVVPGAWFRGNLHTHSNPTSSDCRNDPARQASHDDVAAWFEDHGWDFFVFTEHDAFVDRGYMSNERFLVVNGVELTRGDGAHVGGLGMSGVDDVPPDLHGKVAAARGMGGLPVVNHPGWSLEQRDTWGGDWIEATDDIFESSALHMEVFNFHVVDVVDDRGVDVRIWDELLTRGKRMIGVGADDNHGLLHIGGGWTEVWAEELTEEAVLGALDRGLAYASSGVRIHRIRVAGDVVEIESDADRVTVRGVHGEQRSVVLGGDLSYDYAGEPYVRIEAQAPHGRAWTQAFLPGDAYEIGGPPAPDDPLPAPSLPAALVVEDRPAAGVGGAYPGADIHAVFATLSDGRIVRPVDVVPDRTRILSVGAASDPRSALSDDDLVCGPDWAGFVSLGGAGARLGLRFEPPLPDDAQVTVVEVDRAQCPTASPTPEGYRARLCDEGVAVEDCPVVVDCPQGGACQGPAG